MFAVQSKKDCSLQDMLRRHLGGSDGDSTPISEPDRVPEMNSQSMQAFLESLPSSICDDLQAVKKDLSADLRDIRRKLDNVGQRVSALEDKDDSRSDETERLQQEILRIKDQQLDLQMHT
ncbi:hypothetical protein NDU88_003877 [Pleurodeles waltl]|uniref:Uncharacterized protein n=1 Tax=Pleurodeles waltl TaxID=8319 RepID=A0AAV7PB95_PLEWA|nr:hypothetical protein NDU88_003877 [Pleurodeles waltl]